MYEKTNRASFFNDVFEVVKLVPAGRVTTYGAIGSYLGLKSSARMVGWAMNNSPAGVPAHRVVNRVGVLTGKHFFGTGDEMATLLRQEGIPVVKDQIQHFEQYFWDPQTELI
jgi:methylated-DNA-protein-cysteine methyltransferase-like protein